MDEMHDRRTYTIGLRCVCCASRIIQAPFESKKCERTRSSDWKHWWGWTHAVYMRAVHFVQVTNPLQCQQSNYTVDTHTHGSISNRIWTNWICHRPNQLRDVSANQIRWPTMSNEFHSQISRYFFVAPNYRIDHELRIKWMYMTMYRKLSYAIQVIG